MVVKKCISLFSGIEGFGIAASMMGWELVASVEWEKFPQMVIKKHFQNTQIYGNIKEFNGERYRGTIDIIFGGFPCQPFSVAGQQRGTYDDRYLWPQMLRVIREVKPRWVVAENVSGLLNWSKGLVLDTIIADLENEGFEVIPPLVLPACSVNAPHRRDRLWIVAYNANARVKSLQQGGENGICESEPFTDTYQRTTKPSRTSERTFGSWGNNNDEPKEWGKQTEQHIGCSDVLRNVTNAENCGRDDQCVKTNSGWKNKREIRGCNCQPIITNSNRLRLWRKIDRIRKSRVAYKNSTMPDWSNFPTQSPVCTGNDGVFARLVRYLQRNGCDVYTQQEAEKEAKRIISKVRKEAIKAGGNAVVPQLVLKLFKTIEKIDDSFK